MATEVVQGVSPAIHTEHGRQRYGFWGVGGSHVYVVEGRRVQECWRTAAYVRHGEQRSYYKEVGQAVYEHGRQAYHAKVMVATVLWALLWATKQ
jgi:hypothetical protein